MGQIHPQAEALAEAPVTPLAQLVARIGSPPDTRCWDEDRSTDCWSYSPQMVADLLDAERERMCAAIKAADDKASDGDYMLDSDDCISVLRGTWNPGS